MELKAPFHFSSSSLLSLRDREVRDRLGVYFVEGLRFAHAAISAGAEVLAVGKCLQVLDSHSDRIVSERLKSVPQFTISSSVLSELQFAPVPQGIVLVVRQPPLRWQPVQGTGLWLGIESLQSAGNFGTIIRSAVAAGISGIVLFGNRGVYEDPYEPQVLRAAMGAHFHLPILRSTYRELRAIQREMDIQVLGADGDGSLSYRQVNYSRLSLLMLGAERHGLSVGQRSVCAGFVNIPMDRRVDSLNVAMAATVIMFESAHQRTLCSSNAR